MQIYQIIIVALAGIMIFQGMLKFVRKKSHYSIFKLGTMIFVWGGMAYVIIRPDRSMKVLADFLGIKEGFNALILIGFMLVLVLIFRLLNVIEGIESNMTRLIRQEALRELNKIKK